MTYVAKKLAPTGWDMENKDGSTSTTGRLVIELLKDNKEDMRSLRNEVSGIHDDVQGIGSQVDQKILKMEKDIAGIAVYFEGMNPKVHIIQHAELERQLEREKELAKASRQAFWSVIASVGTALIMAVGAYIIKSAQDDLRHQIEQVNKNSK